MLLYGKVDNDKIYLSWVFFFMEVVVLAECTSLPFFSSRQMALAFALYYWSLSLDSVEKSVFQDLKD